MNKKSGILDMQKIKLAFMFETFVSLSNPLGLLGFVIPFGNEAQII